MTGEEAVIVAPIAMTMFTVLWLVNGWNARRSDNSGEWRTTSERAERNVGRGH